MEEKGKRGRRPGTPWHNFRPTEKQASEGSPLVSAKDGVSDKKYEGLLLKAQAEGRIDGPHECPTCGMKFLNQKEADDCCRVVQ